VPLGASDPVIAPLPLAIGEKMLDFGLLKSLVRAETLPPEDMWFAGEPVAYYYGGHLVAAILTRITGTAGRFAYNLALAGFYAMLVTAVYGVATNVAADRSIPRRLAGVLSVFAVGIASNLTTPGRAVLAVLPDGPSSWLAGVVGVERDGLAAGFERFSYFDASRVISDERRDFAFQFADAEAGATSPTINEFPFFAWFNGDMHAHMMSTAFLVLAAAVCLAYYQTPAREVARRRLLLLGALPPVAGLLAVANTWSFPTPAGLALLTVILAPSDARSLLPQRLANPLPTTDVGREGTRLFVGLGVAVAVVALGLLWSLPFWLGPASGREISILPDRSSLGELLLVHGLFLAVFFAYLATRGRQVFGERAITATVAAVAGVAVFALVDLAALGLFVPLVAGSWLLARRGPLAPGDRDPAATAEGVGSDGGTTVETGIDAVGFETVLIVAGIGLLTLVEFVYLQEPTGRMNTVFKVYMQVWVLWSLAFGPALAWVLTTRLSVPSTPLERARSVLPRVALAALVLSAGLYAPLAITSSYDAEDPTLDGLAYLETEYPEEAAAIHWLDDREGRPTIVTAAPGGYTWDAEDGDRSSAPASLTGLPTVLGWCHEAQYRGQEPYQQRLSDVETIYTGQPDEQAALLAEYDVRYVYVGPVERATYDSITVDQIDGVRSLGQFGAVTIYQVETEPSSDGG
jgi:YYY domain-containing protein